MTLQTAIDIENLTKSYGRGKKAFKAVNGLAFKVEMGQVYGFLGPNGAGKSTTIRMMLGLARPDAGDIRLFGQPLNKAQDVLQKRVGALVEGATLYPYLTGRQNLEVWAKTSNCYNKARIQTLLEQVDMADRADRKASGYSTGMKQRIGIAGALLNNPDLVILDEPTNGLDPRGIQEIRQLIRTLADEDGKTILLSSHMLHEVESVCDRVAIVNYGKLVQEGRVSDLVGNQNRLWVEAEPLASAEGVIQQHFETVRERDHLIVTASRADAPAIVQMLTNANIAIYQVVQQRTTLEELFLNVTEQPQSAEVLTHA